MNYLLVSSSCSGKKYKEIYEKRKKPMLDSSQKFFYSLINGLAEAGSEIQVISSIPVSHKTCDHIVFRRTSDCENGIKYFYCACINLPVIKQITSLISAFIYLLKWVKKHPGEKVILCDPLVLEGSVVVSLFKKKCKSVGILTDMPMMSTFNQMSAIKKLLYRVYNSLSDKLLSSFNGYVFLTENMNLVINKKNKPYMIMECIIDEQRIPCLEESQKHEKKILYAGKLHKEFGMDLLCQALSLIDKEYDIHIYGEGNYSQQLVEQSKLLNNVYVHGVVPYEEIIQEEMSCSLLINPRTSTGDFTKFSFPSKTVEYMATGVPVVMFELDGIPKEYENYIFFVKEETPESFANEINRVLALPESEKKSHGKEGKDFVFREKNKIAQALKLLDFVNENFSAE